VRGSHGAGVASRAALPVSAGRPACGVDGAVRAPVPELDLRKAGSPRALRAARLRAAALWCRVGGRGWAGRGGAAQGRIYKNILVMTGNLKNVR